MQILHYKSLSSLVERNVFEKLEPAYEPFLKQNVFFFLLPDFSNLFIIVSLDNNLIVFRLLQNQ